MAQAPDQRLSSIARKLREEAESFIDYGAIEAEATALGFPTSVRTIRFYVSEGILPPPRKTGKTPVFPRAWIINALLAIHLMKSRLHRSLAEIKEILQNLVEEPEVLADKCTQLYDMVSEPGNLSPADGRWLVDRFFALLKGNRGETSSDVPAGLASTPQPSEVLITDLARELECRRQTDAAVSDASAGRSRSRPRSREEARHLENVFIRGFEAGFRTLRSVYHPLERCSYPTRSSAREPIIADEYLRVVEVLKEARCFDRSLFDSLPLDKSTRFEIAGGRLARKPRLAVIGASWSPTADLALDGASARRAGGSELHRLIERFVSSRSLFHYLAIHSTVGWEPLVLHQLPRGDNYRVALVEYDDEAGWRVAHDFPPQAAALAAFLDPESAEDKTARCRRRLERLPALARRGGFVLLDDLAAALGVPEAIVARAAQELARTRAGWKLATVRGRRLLQRERLLEDSAT
jgi:DNA-binding transcriptional MerR regulator